MKKFIQRLAILSVIVFGISLTGSAQIIVKVRPRAAVVVRSAPPVRGYIWIDGGWVVRNGRYVQTRGYWAAPRRGRHYVAGHWVRRRHGWVWISGYWTKRGWR